MKEKDIKLENSMPVNRWFDYFRKRFGLKKCQDTIEAKQEAEENGAEQDSSH